jgi:hypothetical protein
MQKLPSELEAIRLANFVGCKWEFWERAEANNAKHCLLESPSKILDAALPEETG